MSNGTNLAVFTDGEAGSYNVGGQRMYAVEEIVQHEYWNGDIWFKVKWEGSSKCSWQALSDLLSCRESLVKYFNKLDRRILKTTSSHPKSEKNVKETSQGAIQKIMQNELVCVRQKVLESSRHEPLDELSSSLFSSKESTTKTIQANFDDVSPVLEVNCDPSDDYLTPLLPSPTRSDDNTSPISEDCCKSSSYSDEFPNFRVPDINNNLPDPNKTSMVIPEYDEKLDENNPWLISVLTSVPRLKKLHKIHGAVTVNGNLTLFVEWESNEMDVNLVDSKVMNLVYPEAVIAFYEDQYRFTCKGTSSRRFDGNNLLVYYN